MAKGISLVSVVSNTRRVHQNKTENELVGRRWWWWLPHEKRFQVGNNNKQDRQTMILFIKMKK